MITTRHNGLRDDCFFRCLAAGMDAEREVSGLLPTDPRRRPADIFLPMCPGKGPPALDFAVTCPLRHDMVRDSANRTLVAAMDYEAHKMEDRATAQRCSDLGFTLVPMVAETLGGWGPAAQGVLKTIAKASTEVLGLDESTAIGRLYQGLGIRLQRANARAILSRISAASAANHLPFVLRRRWCCLRLWTQAASPRFLAAQPPARPLPHGHHPTCSAQPVTPTRTPPCPIELAAQPPLDPAHKC